MHYTAAHGLRIVSSPGALLAALYLLLSVRLLFFIDAHAVNLFFSDHWTYLSPMFEDNGAWARFRQQHGPHRQGIAFVISGWLLAASNWNSNVDSMWMLAVLCVTALLLLRLAHRLNGQLRYSDCLLLFFALSPLHYETILLAPNSAHSVVPLLLIVISCFGFVEFQGRAADAFFLFCGFLLLFTGFGFFAGLVLLLLLMLRASVRMYYKGIHLHDLLLCMLALCSLGLFFFDYQLNHATDDFSTALPNNLSYLRFLCYFWAGPLQIRSPYAFAAGGFVLALLLLATLYSLYRLTRETKKTSIPRLQIIQYLLLVSLLYSIAVTVGRISTGADFAQGARYSTLAMPAFIACYLLIDALTFAASLRWLKNAFRILLVLASLQALFLDRIHQEVLFGFQAMKRQWLAEYTPQRSLAEVEEASGVLLLGASQERLHWLQERGLHFPLQNSRN